MVYFYVSSCPRHRVRNENEDKWDTYNHAQAHGTCVITRRGSPAGNIEESSPNQIFSENLVLVFFGGQKQT